MPRQGPRPHVWRVQGELNHEQYCAWLQARAQAQYRKEIFELTFEDFQLLWAGKWDQKGRGANNYCLTRKDPRLPWNIDNSICMNRKDHLRRQRLFKKENKWQIPQEE